MAEPSPYDDLALRFADRKLAYLRALAAKDVTERPAHARGYLRGVPGNKVNVDGREARPTATAQEREAAEKAARDHNAFWEDTPALRVAEPAPPLESEGINDIIARLAAMGASRAQQLTFEAFPPWFAKDLHFPAEGDFLHARQILSFTYVLGIRVWMHDLDDDGHEKSSSSELLVQDWIKRRVAEAVELIGGGTLLDRIRASMDRRTGSDPPTVSADVSRKLGKVTIEDEDAPIAMERATRLMQGIAGFLHTPAIDDDPGDPELYRQLEAALDAWLTRRLQAGNHELPKEIWRALELLSWLGSLVHKPFHISLAELAQRAPKAPNCTTDAGQLRAAGRNPYLLAHVLYRPNVVLPPGWEWPARDATGIYWFRALYRSHLIGHILTYKDTADFHVTDVLRFAALHGVFENARDARVPQYVAAAIKACLSAFKYWFDGPAEFDREQQIQENLSKVEMTFWSENHIVQFACAQVLAGQFMPQASFTRVSRDGKKVTGVELAGRGKRLLRRWLDDRLRFGFSEWNAPGYYNEDFPPLLNIVDFCDDEPLRTKATMVLDLLVFDMARFNSRGSFGTTAGRAYFEHKAYGWRQSVGNTMQLLFGTRGDFTGGENTAIALATSRYEVPHALLAIGLDRVYDDRMAPLIDRSRVSIDRDEAAHYGVGFEDEHDVAYWWSTNSYFTDETLKGTRGIVESNDNLRTTNPFKMLYPQIDMPWYLALVDALFRLAKTPIVGNGVEVAVGGAVSSLGRAGIMLPFPLNLAAWGVSAAGSLMMVQGLVNFVTDFFKAGVRFVGKLLGIGADDEPVVPHSKVIDFLERVLKTFNEGTTLSRANLYSYCNGDVFLGSVQNHLKGKIAFQKSAWQATIDCEACVWTGTPPSNTESFFEGVGVHLRAWLESFKELFQLRPLSALARPALPLVPGDIFGHDGPNYWTGEFALPMVVQHEGAAIIAYNIPNLQRSMHATVTHAWFPRAMFDETDARDKGEGTWVFGRKRDGFIALYSARRVRFAESGLFKDKELYAEGGSNIWVCFVGNTKTFLPQHAAVNRALSGSGQEDPYAQAKAAFAVFKDEVHAAYLSVTGIGATTQLHCSFDMPRTRAPPGRSPRLELFYSDDRARFAGETLALDGFPRFSNKYAQVKWGARRYEIRHPSGLMLSHDHDQVRREHSVQPGSIPMHLSNPARLRPLTPRQRMMAHKRRLARGAFHEP